MPLQPEKFLTRAHIHAGALPPKHDARLDLAHEVRLNLAADVLHRFGEVRFVAHGSSMIPSIYPGDLLTVRSESIAGARCGEIVLFLLSGRFFVHRVMRKWSERNRIVFATRGDALSQEDPSVDGSQLLGRVTSILRQGKPVKFATRLNPWTKFLRWGVRTSDIFAKTLLAAHLLRTRILGGTRQPAATSGKQLQECA
jgi:Peptidase S24-like